jgi:tRNA (adenine22-N1)-methyltransferase
MRLSPRLRHVFELVPLTGAVADIGSGHGALAAALAGRGQRVVATERTPRTEEGLRRDLARLGIPVATRRGEGLAALREGEVETAVIAGLGGRSLLRILESSRWLPRWLVLQPMQDADLVEAWIRARSWPAVAADAVDRGRHYRAWRVEVPAEGATAGVRR